MTEESMITKNGQPQTDWKTRAYTFGAVAGLGFGLVAAYLFARAADEEENPPEPIQTTRLMSVGLAALALMRQITELGRDSDGKGKGKGKKK